MNSTINYLKYIIEHKKNVFIEGRKLGLSRWQLLKHDLSKFSRSEFKQYRDYFFGVSCDDCYHLDDSSYGAVYCRLNLHPPAYKCSQILRYGSENTRRFNEAWQNHKHNNKHHWQYWLDIKNKEIVPLEMPLIYEMEMVADWNAMTRKFKNITNSDDIRNETLAWFDKQDDIILHENTRKSIIFYFDHGVFDSGYTFLTQS
jgi:hypothetical protein